MLKQGYGRSPAQRGVTMVEVLVTIVVISFALLALAGLQVVSLGHNKEGSTRTTATVLGYTILDAMRANRQAALTGQYDIDLADDAPTGTSISESDLSAWLGQLTARLPEGDGAVSVDAATQIVTVTVQWGDIRGNRTDPFVIQSRL